MIPLYLDRKKSYFYANMDSVSSSGYLPMTIHFDVKNKWKGELSNQKIVIYIPQYTELIEDSIKVNGEMGIHRLLRSYVTSLADTNCLNQCLIGMQRRHSNT